MRHLSRWVMLVDGQRPPAMSCDEQAHFATRFWLVPDGFTADRAASLSIVRSRVVCGALHERLTVFNHGPEPRTLTIELCAEADFADLFEVRYVMTKKGTTYRRANGETLVLGYRREDFVRETTIAASRPVEVRDEGLRCVAEVAPGGRWDLDLMISPDRTTCGLDIDACRDRLAADHEQWAGRAPRLTSDWRDLERCYEQSIQDLAALRFTLPGQHRDEPHDEPRDEPGGALPAAGLPWFMTLFGRDSLLTGYFALPFLPGTAAATLRALAAVQGDRSDDFTEEDPGKIPHELRFGELAHFRDVPHACYYGSVDATPLFLVLLEEYVRWTGDTALARELEPNARAALGWLDGFGDGYLSYDCRNPASGIVNQCWKDSPISMRFADGRTAVAPIAVCEAQGYAYDARRRCARLARDVWGDAALAARLDRDAAALRERFNRDFWLADRGYYALALDGRGRAVDSLTSNVGHLLWSGIVDDDKATQVVSHLTGARLASGWGVRTMAVGDGAYNPIAYHNGTVWPHDTAIVAAGLTAYGYRCAATTMIERLVAATARFGYRPPEVFAGYGRDEIGGPAEYPTACRPQAWSSAAFLLAVRLLLGLEPGETRAAPVLPDGVESIRLTGGGRSVDHYGRRLTAHRGGPATAAIPR
jgi:glycogen debranching enzyme